MHAFSSLVLSFHILIHMSFILQQGY